jgi:hypothetical protein
MPAFGWIKYGTSVGLRPVKSLQIAAGLRPVKKLSNRLAVTAGYKACNMLPTLTAG